nr:hypothetical protein [Nanoarchaeota archaeon]
MIFISKIFIENSIDKLAHQAATSPKNKLPEPSMDAKLNGNYKMGHLSFQGLPITIENPQGSVRSGEDKNGDKWRIKMKSHYGFIKGHKSLDGDNVDCFIGPEHKSKLVFVVNQSKGNSTFDEHKVLFGYTSFKQALDGYLVNYEKDWDNIKSVYKTDIDGFKVWLKNKNTKKEFHESFLCIYLSRS